MFFPESLYGVNTKIIAVDFSKGQFVFDTIEKELKDIPVGILGQLKHNLIKLKGLDFLHFIDFFSNLI